MRRIACLMGPALALGLGGAAWGQTAPNNGSEQEGAAEELAPMEVTSGVPAPGDPLLQATQVDVLSGRGKNQQEEASLGATLDQLPGVDNVSAGSSTGKPVIRGLSGTRVRMLSGGMGTDHQQYGTRHGPNIEPFFSDTIEVVRGASSLLYGSDALGGAVNLKPMAIPYAMAGETTWWGETLTRYASNNRQWDAGLKGGAGTDRFGVVGGFVRRSGGNITTPPAEDPDAADAPKFTGELDYTDFDQTNAMVGAGTRGDWGDLQVHYTRWRSEQNFLLADGSGIGQDLADDLLRLEAGLPVSTNWELTPKLMWQNNRRRANAPGSPRAELFDGTIDVEFDQYTGRLEADHQQLLGLDRGTLGVEVMRKEQVSRGTTQLSPGGDVTNVGVFAFEERGFGPLVVQGGARYDHREVTADEGETASSDILFSGRSGETYDVVTGSLGAIYRFTPHLSLAANAARGFRAPTLFELFAKGVHGGVAAAQLGNPDLDPEKSIDTDLSLRWRSANLQATATVYRNGIRDYIFLRDTGDQTDDGLPIFRYDQANAVLKGMDLDISGKPVSWLELGASASVVEGENRDTNENLPMLPANKVRFSVSYQPTGGGSVSNPYLRLGVRHAFAQNAAPTDPFVQFDDKPFGTASTEAYTLLDLSAGLEWSGLTRYPMQVHLEVRNVLDESYRDFLDTYKGYALSPGRDIRATVRIPFAKTPAL